MPTELSETRGRKLSQSRSDESSSHWPNDENVEFKGLKEKEKSREKNLEECCKEWNQKPLKTSSKTDDKQKQTRFSTINQWGNLFLTNTMN